MGGIDPDTMRKLLQPLFDANLVGEALGKYSIEAKSDI